jgi:aryl-alcohol dehydrogenase-like predicted oxidoreductase
MLSRVALPSAPFTVSAFCLGGGGFGSSVTGDALDRLGRGIDLYWLHRDDPRVPVAELLDALNGAIAASHVRALGASNWSTARLAEANACAAARGWTGFCASQPMWNLAAPNFAPTADPTMRFLLPDDAAWHAQSGVAVVPYAPTANGYFATNGERGGGFENPTSRARLQRAQALATELGRTPNQVALAWLRSHPFPVVPILGATNPDHLAEGLAATFTLTEAQRGWLAEG